MAAFSGRIYVAGGEVPILFDINEVYDPALDAWATLAPMSIPRHGVASVALDDRILVPAGGAVQGATSNCGGRQLRPAGTERACGISLGAGDVRYAHDDRRHAPAPSAHSKRHSDHSEGPIRAVAADLTT